MALYLSKMAATMVGPSKRQVIFRSLVEGPEKCVQKTVEKSCRFVHKFGVFLHHII